MPGRSFELQRELGDGAFGTVYLADMVSLGGFRKSVAIKLLKPDWDAASDAARRLRDEARLLGRLRHRHIVQVDDLIRLDGRWAVVMEYVPGVDLEVLIQHARGSGEGLPVVASLDITAAVAQALDAAWNGQASGEDGPLRVVHRDIKPSNIRLTAQGDVKVLDFGIARADFEGREAKTDKIRYGSVAYMSPERLLGDPEVPAGDVYAVGVVLYELLTGTTYGRTKLAPDRAEQQRQGRLAEARELLGADLDPVLDLVERCLAYEVEDRPDAATVAVEARQLARHFEDEDIYSYARRTVPDLGAAGMQIQRRMLTEEHADSATFPFGAEDPASDEPSASRPTPTQAPRTTQPTLGHELDTRPTSPAGSPRVLVFITAAATALATLVVTGVLLHELTEEPEQPAAGQLSPAPSPAPAVVEEPSPPAEEEPLEPGDALAEAEPEPEPQEEPEPEQPAAPTSPAPAAVKAPSTSSAPPVDRAKFFVPGATRVRVSCGGVSNSSTTQSVQLNDFPAGSCSVQATLDQGELQASLTVTRPAGYTCEPSGSSLSCRKQ